MRILVVCSGNAPGFSFEKHQAFIYDQIKSIQKVDTNINYFTFFIKGKGICGYLRNIPRLKRELYKIKPDIIHAHGGIVSLLCVLQRKVHVVTTFHGSDINIPFMNILSYVAGLFSKRIIFVSKNLKHKSICNFNSKSDVIPCGVNLDIFLPQIRETTLSAYKTRKILFASAFDNPVKNYKLAKKALAGFENIDFIELKDKTREEVCYLINSVDLVLMTSITEGSPQIIKEAMACNCPVVSTDTGDVRWIIGNTEGCYICSFNPVDVAEKISMALEFSKVKDRTKGRQRIIELGLDSETIAGRIINVYKKIRKTN